MLTPKRPEATCLIAERRESPFASRHVAHRILAALAGVRLAAEPVHRDRERLVRLARERAERHGAGREALDDLGRRLDLLDRDRRLRVLEAEQSAQRRLAAPRRRSRAARTPRRSRSRRGAPRAGGARSSPGSTGGARLRRATRRRRRAGAGPRRAGYARACRSSASRASTSVPMPPIRDGVPVKCRSTSRGSSPTASKICAPQ